MKVMRDVFCKVLVATLGVPSTTLPRTQPFDTFPRFIADAAVKIHRYENSHSLG